MSDENLISLKEAAQISGYAPDYVGQLIRSGKIFGKQVYTGVAWMTSKEAVLGYKHKSKSENAAEEKGFWLNQKTKFLADLNLLKLFIKSFSAIIPILILLSLGLSLLSIYIGYQLAANKFVPETTLNKNSDK